MLEGYRYRRERRKIERRYEEDLNAAKAKRDQDETQLVVSNIMFDIQLLDEAVNYREGWRLMNEAALLDVQTPRVDDESGVWEYTDDGKRLLTTKGRADLRKLVDAEKTRRWEVRAWWWKTIVVPALTALTGLIGVIIGLVAVLKK